MYVGDVDGGDETPKVIEAMTNRFGQESMLRLYQGHSLDGL